MTSKYYIFAVLAIAVLAHAGPVSQPDEKDQDMVEKSEDSGKNLEENSLSDLSAAASEENNNKFVETSIGATGAGASAYDLNGMLPQDAYNPYVNQFGGAYAPYPAPIGYVPAPAYANPYAVQTGYEGYMVGPPATSNVESADPFAFFSGIIPRAMMGWIFRTLAVVISMLGVVSFGGAITTAICTLTPLCSISFRALSLLKSKETAEAIGKTIGNAITPERVRRASEFVKMAIKKYDELQATTD